MLFKTIAELQAHVAFNVNTSINVLKPYIEAVERRVLSDIISVAQYAALHTAYQAATVEAPLAGDTLKLLTKSQYVVANLACENYLPLANVHLSGMGISVQKSEDSTWASQWMVNDVKTLFLMDGHQGIEELLNYLWSVATGTFESWDASTNKTEWRSYMLLTAKEFSKYFFINNSRYIFEKLKSSQLKVQNHFIKPVIGAGLFDQILSQVMTNSVSANNKILLDNYIKPAIACLSFKEGARFLKHELNDYGINKKSTGNFDNIVLRNVVDSNELQWDIMASENEGQYYLSQLRKYLNENASNDLYPLYYTSSLYQDPASADYTDRLNMTKEGGKNYIAY